ncbi:MAG: hypothetical protein A4E53_03956 [Pelotomaculum sp. PtaB.Bin104]|nr:MAG: hypothetical protein A4E53_03956 [Pelotomaculum sp. PtaB.Bin104]
MMLNIDSKVEEEVVLKGKYAVFAIPGEVSQ